MNDYTVTIIKTSKELSNKERIKIKDTMDAIGIDEATQSGAYEIQPDVWALLSVHNEYARDNKDYDQLVILGADGEKYYTGSGSFIQAFIAIAEEMADDPEPWSISAYRVPSKNYTGKEFLSCSIK